MSKKLHKKYLQHLLGTSSSSTSHGVLNVKPMRGRYIWITEQLPRPFEGTIVFDAKGSNDISVCLHHSKATEVVGRDGLREGAPAYEILIGGWSNTKSAIRKHGQQQVFVGRDASNAVIQSSAVFVRYWITLHASTIFVGMGEAGSNEILQWKDPAPEKDVVFIGVSSWNSSIQFKNVGVTPPIIPYSDFHFNSDCLVNRPLLSDRTLTVGGQKIPVHTAVLTCWSKAFLQGSDGPAGAIDWEHLDADLFIDLLTFMYTGEIPERSYSREELYTTAETFGIGNALRDCLLAHTGCMSLSQHVHSPRDSAGRRSSVSSNSSGGSAVLAYHSYRQLIPRVARFRKLLFSEELSDVTFILDDDKASQPPRIPAHRAILALWSNPFLAMFTSHMKESSMKEVHVREAASGPFKALLEYCYCGSVDLNPEHAIAVLFLADRFQVTPLLEYSSDLLREYIDPDNCCALLNMADRFSWKSIMAHCMRFLESNFQRVCVLDEFFSLPPLLLISLLLSDNLLVSDESVVFQATDRWCRHHFQPSIDDWLLRAPIAGEGITHHESGAPASGPGEAFDAGPDVEYDDLQIVEDLLSCVRFPLMTEAYLRENVLEHPLFTTRTRLIALVHEAMNSEEPCSGEQQDSKSTFRHKNRAASHYQQLLYSHSGDKNGVCYFVGCNYGTSMWTNPHKTGRLLIAMSSPPTKYTKPDALVSRSFASTNFCTGNPEPWVSLELLDGHKLICNYYWIRQDGSSAFPRNWTLQASNDPDLDGWTDLRVHKADPSIHQPGQDAAWPVFGKAARTPYRCFRLELQGPCYNGQHHIAICGLELYGYFI